MSKESSIKDFARIDQSSDPPFLCANYPQDLQERHTREPSGGDRLPCETLSCDVYHDLAQFSACNGSLLQCNVINSLFITELGSKVSTTVLDLKHELQQKLYLSAQELHPRQS